MNFPRKRAAPAVARRPGLSEADSRQGVAADSVRLGLSWQGRATRSLPFWAD